MLLKQLTFFRIGASRRKAVHIIGNTYYLMSPFQLEEFCHWIYAARRQKLTLLGTRCEK